MPLPEWKSQNQVNAIRIAAEPWPVLLRSEGHPAGTCAAFNAGSAPKAGAVLVAWPGPVLLGGSPPGPERFFPEVPCLLRCGLFSLNRGQCGVSPLLLLLLCFAISFI